MDEESVTDKLCLHFIHGHVIYVLAVFKTIYRIKDGGVLFFLFAGGVLKIVYHNSSF